MLLSDFCTTQNTITAILVQSWPHSTLALSHLSSICNTCANYLEAPLANSLNILLSARKAASKLRHRQLSLSTRKSTRFSIAGQKMPFRPTPQGKWATAKINFPKTGVWVSVLAIGWKATRTHRGQKPFPTKPAGSTKSSFNVNSGAEAIRTHIRTRAPAAQRGFAAGKCDAQMSFPPTMPTCKCYTPLKGYIKGCKSHSLSGKRTFSLRSPHYWRLLW
jgi:hypothetical protein